MVIDRGRPLAPWLILSGVVLQLAGLTWDAVLHGQDHGLAAAEGLFSLRNPAHLLFASGLGMAVAGTVLLLVRRTPAHPVPGRLRRAYRIGAAAGLVLMSGVTSVFAMSVGAMTS